MKRKKGNRNIKTHYPKCPITKKSMFVTEAEADRVKMRVWSHDPQANIRDLHSYLCPDCNHYHVGHKSYYQMAQNKIANSQSVNI